MGSIRQTAQAFTALGTLLLPAAAQTPPPDTQARQPPAERGGLGEVSLEIQTTLPENQEHFARGVAFLHAHSYLQAEREFMQIVVTEKDPPMAYWGLAWANFDEPDRAADYIERGVLYLKKATPQQRQWIEALARFYEVAPETAAANQQRREKAGPTEAVASRKFRRSLAKRLRALASTHRSFADAKEASPAAAFFYADLVSRFESQIKASKVELDALLRAALKQQPGHAGRYHLMELWRWTDPDRARKTALSVATATPSVSTQWLLAGRVLDGCGQPGIAAQMYEAAMRLAHTDMLRYRLMPFRVAHYPSILWLRARALIRAGQIEEALTLASRADAMPRHPKYNQAGNPSHLAGLGPRIRIVAVAVGGGNQDLVGLQASATRAVQAHRFGRVTLAADFATAYLATLDKKRGASFKDRVRRARADAWPKDQAARIDDWIKRHAALFRKATLAPAIAIGKVYPTPKTIKSFETPPPRDDILDFYFDSRGSAETLALRIHSRNTDGENREAFEQLANAAPRADLGAHAFRHLAAVAKRLGLPDDWRQLAAKSPIGPLDSLGPATWQPFAAPDSLIKQLSGKAIDLSTYRGKPVVAIQYLGFGCLHCVEQLRKFHPHVGAYRTAGLRILAIGTDTPKNMRESIVDLPPSEKLAYTMLSDRKMRTFRSWRAYDFFRHLPLHGTYLLDSEGKVLWQDISWQPFEEPVWFLAESKRLLEPAKAR